MINLHQPEQTVFDPQTGDTVVQMHKPKRCIQRWEPQTRKQVHDEAPDHF